MAASTQALMQSFTSSRCGPEDSVLSTRSRCVRAGGACVDTAGALTVQGECSVATATAAAYDSAQLGHRETRLGTSTGKVQAHVDTSSSSPVRVSRSRHGVSCTESSDQQRDTCGRRRQKSRRYILLEKKYRGKLPLNGTYYHHPMTPYHHSMTP